MSQAQCSVLTTVTFPQAPSSWRTTEVQKCPQLSHSGKDFLQRTLFPNTTGAHPRTVHLSLCQPERRCESLPSLIGAGLTCLSPLINPDPMPARHTVSKLPCPSRACLVSSEPADTPLPCPPSHSFQPSGSLPIKQKPMCQNPQLPAALMVRLFSPLSESSRILSDKTPLD